MMSECNDQQKNIPRSLSGDLNPDEQKQLDQHLAGCRLCSEEHERYARTLHLLQSSGDEPVPRHFFVYPAEDPSTPWMLFRRLGIRWQVSAVAFVALVLLLSAASISGLQIRYSRGAWAVSFGTSGSLKSSDIATLKTDILNAAAAQNREAATDWFQRLRYEFEQSRADLTQEQQAQLVAAIGNLESRINSRISSTTDDLRSGTQKSISDMYRTVSLQQEQDFDVMNTRLNQAAAGIATKDRQTDAILDTLIQVANLSLRQPGEEK